jgi:hypothetical protein
MYESKGKTENVMALYKNGQYLTKSEDAAFDKEYDPGSIPPHSGIYRCTGCRREVVAEESRSLPPQNHHQHPGYTPVKWKLAVYADHREK